MSDRPTRNHRSESTYLRLTAEEDAAAREALEAIVAEEDAGRISPLQAADERLQLLEQHLERTRAIRVRYLGGQL